MGRAAAVAGRAARAPPRSCSPATRSARRGRTRSGWSTGWCPAPSCTSASRRSRSGSRPTLRCRWRRPRSARCTCRQPEAWAQAEELWAPVYRSADAQEGPRAFREKRDPLFGGAADMPVSMSALADDLAADRRCCARCSSRSTRTAGGSRPRRRAGRCWTRSPTSRWFDEAAVRSAAGAGRVRGRAAPPGPRRGGGGVPRPVRRRGAGLVRRRQVPAARRVPRAGPGAAGALVRAADERGVGAHRADHGDVGARPGRRRRRSACAGSRRPGCGTSRTSGSARGPTATPSTGEPRRTRRSGWSSPRPTATPGPGAPGRRRPGRRARAGLLPRRHPAPSPRRHRAAGDRARRDRVDELRPGLRGPRGNRQRKTRQDNGVT